MRLFVCLMVLTSGQVATAQGEPKVIAKLRRDQIYEGDSVHYEVRLDHMEQASPPKLEGFDDFDVKFLGEHSRLNQRISLSVNGRVVEIVRRTVHSYELTPRRSGDLEVPAPIAEVDGRTLKGNALTLHVVAPQVQDVVILELTADPASVYLMQPFTVTLNVAVKELPEPFSDRNPISVLQDPPALSLPWVDEAELPEGLEAATSWQEWLQPMLVRRGGGLNINKLTNRSSFFSFDDPKAAFLPKPQRTIRKDLSGNDVGYWEFAYARTFTPKELGQFSFGPVKLTGTFATRIGIGPDSRGRLEGEGIYARANSILVTVRDVPLEGRPDSYIGAVGRFEIVSDLVPKSTKVGDPLTWTLTLRGSGTLDRAKAPQLERFPEIAEHFKIYDATSKTRDHTKTFTYSLRPLRAGIDRFPSVPVAYFDVEREKYITLRSESIPIEVSPAEHLSDTDITMADASQPKARTLEVRTEGIFANITDPSAIVDQSVRPARWFMGLGGMACAYLMVVLVTQQVQRLTGDKQLVRRREAGPRARRRLRDAMSEANEGRLRAAADHLRVSLVGLVADIAHVPEEGLTSTDAREHLVTMGVDEELVDRLSKLLDACDGVRYGASEGALVGLGQEAENVLQALMRALSNKRPRS